MDASRERVLRLLELTTRPLRPAEIESALCLASGTGAPVCRWLISNGYAANSHVERGERAGLRLGERGRSWIKSQGGVTHDI